MLVVEGRSQTDITCWLLTNNGTSGVLSAVNVNWLWSQNSPALPRTAVFTARRITTGTAISPHGSASTSPRRAVRTETLFSPGGLSKAACRSQRFLSPVNLPPLETFKNGGDGQGPRRLSTRGGAQVGEGEDLGSAAALPFPSVKTGVRCPTEVPLCPQLAAVSAGRGAGPGLARREGAAAAAAGRALLIRAFQLSRGSAPRGPSRLYTGARGSGDGFAPPARLSSCAGATGGLLQGSRANRPAWQQSARPSPRGPQR